MRVRVVRNALLLTHVLAGDSSWCRCLGHLALLFAGAVGLRTQTRRADMNGSVRLPHPFASSIHRPWTPLAGQRASPRWSRKGEVSTTDMPVLVEYLARHYGPVPYGAGKRILLNNTCTIGHDLGRISSAAALPDEWEETLVRAPRRGAAVLSVVPRHPRVPVRTLRDRIKTRRRVGRPADALRACPLAQRDDEDREDCR